MCIVGHPIPDPLICFEALKCRTCESKQIIDATLNAARMHFLSRTKGKPPSFKSDVFLLSSKFKINYGKNALSSRTMSIGCGLEDKCLLVSF